MGLPGRQNKLEEKSRLERRVRIQKTRRGGCLGLATQPHSQSWSKKAKKIHRIKKGKKSRGKR